LESYVDQSSERDLTKKRAVQFRAEGAFSLVTGGSRGIGYSIARALAFSGSNVCITAVNTERLESARARLASETGATIVALPCDVGDEAQVKALFCELKTRWPFLDMAVNNAGIGVFKKAVETTGDEWDRVMRVNARGTFLCCREEMLWMAGTGGGRIVNVSSVVGRKGYPNQAVYSASKHAIMGLTKVLAVEGQADNIRVQAICPGGTDTELISRARPDLDRSGLIRPEDVAGIVMFLLTLPDNAVVDEINVRRAGSQPGFAG